MYDKSMYIDDIEDRDKFLKMYYKNMMFFNEKHLKKALERHSKFEGDAISQELRCCFANEFEEWEEDYFGESGVAYYFDYPAVEKDCIVILTYKEFYEYLLYACKKYIEKHSEEKDIIYEYLNKIKVNLNL
ncbi:ribonuclease toxin immunity protein CdiI [Hathewaya histolytica]|uniref:ribonuclease toxin immunity protein CdiI n=1 Tax=Hathewaya histolytica TaxID=1498 RepID=UPI003B681AA6